MLIIYSTVQRLGLVRSGLVWSDFLSYIYTINMCDGLHAVLVLSLAVEDATVVSHGMTPPAAVGVPAHN